MTIYYVKSTGSGAGGLTTATAFTTISAGCLVAVAGDTINVLAGNYQGGIYISTAGYPSGTAANPITLKSSPALAARIVATATPPTGGGNDAMIDIRENWWVIDGFEITAEDGYNASNVWQLGGAGQYRTGIYLGGSNLVVQNCWVHHTCQADPAGGGGAGITSDGFYVNYALQNNYVRFNKVHNTASSLTTNKAHGIYFSGAGAHAQGNLVYNMFGGVLIHGWHGQTGGSYSNNTVFNSTLIGLLIGQGDGGAGTGVANFRGFNNTIQNCATAISEQGIIAASPRCLWSHNHIYNCTTDYSIHANSTATNRLVGAPLMVNYVQTGGGDYRLSSTSALIGAGIRSLSGVNAPITDIAGTTRPQNTTYDIGAYEYIATDTTPPVLTSPFAEATGTLTADARVTTDDNTGTLYCFVSTNSTELASLVRSNGVSQAITLIGPWTFNITGLSIGTTYYAHFVHVDANSNESIRVSSTSFITDASTPPNTSGMGGMVRKMLRRS